MVLSLHGLGGTFCELCSECILVDLEEAPFHSLRLSLALPMGGKATLSVPRVVAALGGLNMLLEKEKKKKTLYEFDMTTHVQIY